MKRETYMLAIMTAIMCIAIIAFAVVFRMVGLADNTIELPEPEYTTPDEVVLLRAEAPEAVPDELAELAGRAVWGEAGGIQDYAQRAAVIWCACNRADAWGMDIGDVLNVDQFHGLAIKGKVPPPSMWSWRGMCWQGGRWRLRAGLTLAGRCLSSTCISRATACATISARSTEAGNIGVRDN